MRRAVLFSIGGACYFLLEVIWRGHSHPTMFVVGGLCFLMIGEINEHFSWEMPIWMQMVIGSAIITMTEFVSGIFLNCFLRLGVWDYSAMPFNVMGQICLPYTLLWIPVSLIAILLDDYLRWRLFHEEKPHYTWRI